MHRITTPDGRWRQSTFLRVVRTVAYGAISLAGMLTLVSPLDLLLYGDTGIAMTWFLVVGGGLASVGAATVRWFGEFIGLPLLSSSFCVLGILVWRAGFDATPFIASANMLLLVAFGLLLAARWRVVLAVFRIAETHLPDHFSGDSQ
jgi:hypothetical protein